MKLVRHLTNIPWSQLEAGSVVTIGSFDGLHLGHQKLLERVVAAADESGHTSIVMSFEPTPKEFFHSEKPPARLMRFREKYEALDSSDIDMFFCPRFTQQMRNISALDFVRALLIHGLNARHLVVGDDFRFARRREGDIALFERLHEPLGFTFEQVQSVVVDGTRVSSTAIRDACAIGDMRRAAALLGRPYRMSGRIIEGDQVGRTLGFPTANVDLRRRQSAVMGVFAVRVHGVGNAPRDGVASVGSRPTFHGTKPILEVYLLDFEDDIYGEYIHVDFIEHLREQRKYDEIEELVAQMHVDVDNARSILASSAA